MIDRLLFAGYLRCYPPERPVPTTVLESAVYRLRLALAERAEDGMRAASVRGRLPNIPLETFLPPTRCACGETIPRERHECDRCVTFGLRRCHPVIHAQGRGVSR